MLSFTSHSAQNRSYQSHSSSQSLELGLDTVLNKLNPPHKEVCVEPPSSALNTTLPAFATKRKSVHNTAPAARP